MRCNAFVSVLDNVSMTNKEVAGLVAQARNGSAEARDELVRRYYRDIAAIAATLVNDATEGEDLAQEAFITWMASATRGFRPRSTCLLGHCVRSSPAPARSLRPFCQSLPPMLYHRLTTCLHRRP